LQRIRDGKTDYIWVKTYSRALDNILIAYTKPLKQSPSDDDFDFENTVDVIKSLKKD